MAASVEFELEEFEYVPATAGTALVRVAGKWHAEPEQELPPLALLVRTPLGDDRVEPLPDAAGRADRDAGRHALARRVLAGDPRADGRLGELPARRRRLPARAAGAH